jgi:hypothetical protein
LSLPDFTREGSADVPAARLSDAAFPGFEDPDPEEPERDDFEFISEDELAEALKK